jgi:hypothetical protein
MVPYTTTRPMYEYIIQTRVRHLGCLGLFQQQIPSAFSPNQRTSTSNHLVHVPYRVQITDNGLGKRLLVSLRREPFKNAF